VVWVAPRALRRRYGLIATQIFSFISVGKLIAPVLGGVLYDNASYSGAFGLGSGILSVDFIVRILLIEKKVAARYNSTLINSAANPRYRSTENGDAEANDEADKEDVPLPKTKEEEFKIPEGQNKLVHSLPILYCLYDPRLLTALLVAFVKATLLATFEPRSQQKQRHCLASHH
jgi:MFS family permease